MPRSRNSTLQPCQSARSAIENLRERPRRPRFLPALLLLAISCHTQAAMSAEPSPDLSPEQIVDEYFMRVERGNWIEVAETLDSDQLQENLRPFRTALVKLRDDIENPPERIDKNDQFARKMALDFILRSYAPAKSIDEILALPDVEFWGRSMAGGPFDSILVKRLSPACESHDTCRIAVRIDFAASDERGIELILLHLIKKPQGWRIRMLEKSFVGPGF